MEISMQKRISVSLLSAPVVESRHMGAFCRKSHLLIKDCSEARTAGGFSSATFKDYRSVSLVNDFGARDPVLYSIVYTTAGYSLGKVAQEYNRINGISGRGIDVVSVIDQGLDPAVKRALASCSSLAELPLGKKIFTRMEVREAAKAKMKDDGREYIDAENHPSSYERLAREIVAERPDAVFMPLGGGEAVHSMLRLLATLADSGARTPRLYAATIRANVFAGRTAARSIAEKLVTPWSELAGEIRKALPRFGEVVVVEEADIMPAYNALKDAGIKAEPSAAVAFAAARMTDCPEGSRVLVVNSGCGIHYAPDGVLRGVPDDA